MAGARGHEMAAFRASILFYLLLCFMLETTSGDLASLNVTRHHQDRFTEECKICSSKKAQCFGTQTCECRPSNSVFQINKGECTVGRDIIAANGCMDWHDPNNGDDYLQLINLRNKSPHRYRFVLSPNVLMCSIPKSAKASVKILDSAGSWKPKELPVSSPGDKRISPVSINGSSLQICGGPDLDSAGAGYIIKVTVYCRPRTQQDVQRVRSCLIFKASGTLTINGSKPTFYPPTTLDLSSTRSPTITTKTNTKPVKTGNTNSPQRDLTRIGIIIGAAVGVCVVLIVFILVLIKVCCARKSRQKEEEHQVHAPPPSPVYEQIEPANNTDSTNQNIMNPGEVADTPFLDGYEQVSNFVAVNEQLTTNRDALYEEMNPTTRGSLTYDYAEHPEFPLHLFNSTGPSPNADYIGDDTSAYLEPVDAGKTTSLGE